MRVLVNGKRLFFDVSGEALTPVDRQFASKPTLILLHGAPGNSDHSVFKPMFAELGDIAHVVYLDLAGSGRSDDPTDGVFSLESWADDLFGFCDALEIERPVVLGNSAGGMVAAAYASKYPDHPGGLILSSTQARLDTDRCLEKFEQLGGVEVREIARRALVTHGDTASFIEYARRCMSLYNPTPQSRTRRSIYRPVCADAFHKLGGVWHQMDILEDIRAIACPTLILVGEEDPVTPVQDSEDIAAQLDPGLVRLERFPNAGHGVWLDDQVAAFRVIREFITTKEQTS